MADVGLDADLLLDIRNALRAVDRVEDALDRASQVVITADAREVTASIDAAVQNADTDVAIMGDAAELTGDVTAAIDAADSNVVVTGDAAELTGDVTAAVDAGDSQVTVTADTTQAQAEVEDLGDAADDAAGGASRLGAALAGIGVAAIAKGLFEVASAASDLEESASKAAQVFGDSIGVIEGFAESADTSLGLSEQAALEATGTFGNLFQALGVTRTEAAALAPEVVTLASDLASFNNLGVEDTLEKIRSGLVGEIEPLRSLGVSFLAADVEARGLELGLQDVNGELSEGAKVQARYSLITEQTALAQGDFARTSDGLANQQRILTAEFQNLVAEAGQALLPTLLEIVATAREDLIPRLGQLSDTVLPALAQAFAAGVPLIGSTLDILTALAPVVQVLGTALSAIPAPVVQLIGTFVAVNRALRLAGVAFDLLKTKAQTAGTAIAASNPLFLAATVAIGALTAVLGANSQKAAAAEQAQQGYASTLSTTQPTVEAFTEGVETAAAANGSFAEGLAGVGLTAEEFASILAGDLNPNLADNADLTGEQLFALIENRDAMLDAAEAALALGVATGDYTETETDAAIARNTAEDGTVNYIAALAELRDARLEDQAAAEETIGLYQDEATAVLTLQESLDGLAGSGDDVVRSTGRLVEGIGDTETNLLRLAIAADEAGLSEEQMADLAAVLGVELADLQGFIEGTAGAVQGFVDTAVGELPKIADAFEDTNEDSVVSAREFIDGLAEQSVAMLTFIDDIQTIVAAGYTDLGALLSEQGREIAGQAAADFADAAREGNTALLDEAQAGIDGRNEIFEGGTEFFRDILGPAFVLESGIVAENATEAFGAGFTPEEQTRIAVELAQTELDVQGQEVAAIAATVGEDAARDYGEALDMDRKSIDEAVAAGVAIRENAPLAAAADAGSRSSGKWGQSLRLDDQVRVASSQAGKALRDSAPTVQASQAGAAVGASFASGVQGAVLAGINVVAAAAAQLVRDAKASADAEARTGSPSRLFAELGSNIAGGLAVGIEGGAAEVAASAEALVAAAAREVSAQPVRVRVDGSIVAASGTDPAPGGTRVVVERGAVQIRLDGVQDPQVARDVGSAAGESLLATIAAERNAQTLARVEV